MSSALPTVSAAKLLLQNDDGHYSTGYPCIDRLLNGSPAGVRIIQISGPPGSGADRLFSTIIHSALTNGDQVLGYSYAVTGSNFRFSHLIK
jgi:RecA/RadA recombinase